MTLLERNVSELNDLIIKGDTLRAMELFYAAGVIMQENEEEPRRGKELCIEHEAMNLKNVKELKSRLLNQAIDLKRNVVFSEWEIIFITRSDKKMKLNEVSVQHWKNDQIVNEKFYYKAFSNI